MKVNLQKIIAFISVLCICFSLLGISAFAYTVDVDYIYTSEKDAFSDTVNLINAYSNGEISYNDFASDLVYIQGKASSAGLDVAAVKIKQFIDVCNLRFGADSNLGGSEHGGAGAGGSRTPITDIWNDICNKNNVPTETTQTSSVDYLGYGAVVELTNLKAGSKKIFYCDYIVILDDGLRFKECAVHLERWFNSSVSFSDYHVNYTNVILTFDYSNFSYKFYGDIRHEDNTPAPTDDEFTYGSIYNYEGLSEKELKKLIEELADKIQVEYPDLSTVEGLLNAIYGRLSELDSDDDNQLLSQVLTAINSLKISSDKNASSIISVLEDIKKSLIEDKENKDDNKDLAEQLKVLIDNQITFDDFSIDEDMYNNNLEILKLRLLGKFSFIEDLKTFVSHIFDIYKNTSDSPKFSIQYSSGNYDIDFSFFNDFLPLIRCTIAAFIYISYALHTYKKIPSYINGGDNL